MPKGVEHRENAADTGLRSTVKIPMMPKGVEHEVSVFVNASSGM